MGFVASRAWQVKSRKEDLLFAQILSDQIDNIYWMLLLKSMQIDWGPQSIWKIRAEEMPIS